MLLRNKCPTTLRVIDTDFEQSMSTTCPSIYIPRVYHTVTWQEMMATFEEVLGKGNIKRVNIVKIKARDGDKPPAFNRAYVEIKQWPESHFAARDKILAGGSIDLYPDENSDHYWLCVLNKNMKDEKVKGPARMVVDNVKMPEATLGEHAPSLTELGDQDV